MTFKHFFSFRTNGYFWLNLLGMVVVVLLLFFGTFKWLDSYTRHGEAVVVPDVKGLSVGEADRLLRNRKLTCEVSDSTYVKTVAAGAILDSQPAAGQKVKEGRVVYLTINTLSIPTVSVPKLADNSSVRQAQARLLASGFRLEENELVSGEKDWVYGVKYKGRLLLDDEEVPIGATLMLVVGDGGA
ncbi:MAG: PASTA domain-containing protein, partial [Prevotellaceae bacterium]|nr:PASTA domain-containing protein [Prevotellaceae bacterium]